MPVFNYATRELVLKIVYYGPALCGKTTNLEYIYGQLPPDKKGKMLSLATEADRTLFFDFLPLELGTVYGWKIRIQLYTVPGQVFYDATRRLVLKGADGVVFVADSQKEMLESNVESWENMKTNLAYNNLDFWTIPLVIQYNKRDLKNILPIPVLEAHINERSVPYFSAVAVRGTGVMETLREAVKLTLQAVQQRIAGRPEATVGGSTSEASPPRVETPPPTRPEVSPPRAEPSPPPASEVSPSRVEPSPPPLSEGIPEVTPESVGMAPAPETLEADVGPLPDSADEMVELQPIEEVMAPMPAVPEVPAPPPEEKPIESLETVVLREPIPPPPEEPVVLPPKADLSTAPPVHPSPPEGPPPPVEQPVSPLWTVDARSEPVTVEVASTTEGLHIRLTLHITLHLITRTDGSAES